MFRRIQHIHFVGIGGIGMSGIAEVLANLGFKVTGSDLKRTNNTDHLETLKVIVSEGHDAMNIGDAHVVVRSSAVRDDNPEIIEAQRRMIPVIPRAEMLAELMRLKTNTVAVAGSHGKTTTTSMIATVLGTAGLDPTFVIGGVVNAFGSNARLGKSDWMVVEADESDRSFLMLTPTISVVTNIDREHMDCYHDMHDVQESFASFANKVPFYGASILCLDNPYVQAIIPEIKRRRITYGFSAQADVSAHGSRYDKNFGASFTLWQGARAIGEVKLRVPGGHNIYNALAAITVGLELNIPFQTISQALEGFTGVKRRFQFKGEKCGILVIDDYGHHPTEIRATLAAAKHSADGRRIVVLFEPHRYTRTKDLMEEFARSFNNADVLLIADIYAASEEPIPGITAEALCGSIKSFGHKNVSYIGSIESATEILAGEVRTGDIVITLGAGNVYRAGESLLKIIGERSASA
ncbi:MAG: UDP-N-acetylmuramate--L-alanine ligase [Pyrinomonadaceae bacterium]